jgi:hypothetical protein
VPYTTTTLGIIFIVQTAMSVERLAEELDHLNQQTPSAQWIDMVVVQSKATINYAVQFPSAKILGDYLPQPKVNAHIRLNVCWPVGFIAITMFLNGSKFLRTCQSRRD